MQDQTPIFLIAATALEYGLTVLTANANAKHFGAVGGLTVERFEV